MKFEQINKLMYQTDFNDLGDMGEVSVKGIRFFNEVFGELVREARCDWDTKKVTFFLRNQGTSVKEIEDRLRGTENSVKWNKTLYEFDELPEEVASQVLVEYLKSSTMYEMAVDDCRHMKFDEEGKTIRGYDEE